MPSFVGFSSKQQKVLQKIHVEAVRCLEAAVSSIGDSTYMMRYSKYFGNASSSTGSWGNSASSSVNQTINAMYVAVKENNYVVNNEGKSNSTNADMAHLTSNIGRGVVYEGKAMTILEANDLARASELGGNKLPMGIYSRFFSKLKLFKLDKQSQIQVYLHELSHHAGGTIDVDLGGGRIAYGFEGVKQARNIGKGHLNAENFGMFLQSYYIGKQ